MIAGLIPRSAAMADASVVTREYLQQLQERLRQAEELGRTLQRSRSQEERRHWQALLAPDSDDSDEMDTARQEALLWRGRQQAYENQLLALLREARTAVQLLAGTEGFPEMDRGPGGRRPDNG